MMIITVLSLLGLFRVPAIQGFVPASLPHQCHTNHNNKKNNNNNNKNGIQPPIPTVRSTRLFVDTWDRMEIEEDDQPYWYLLNCVAGLEMDLLRQVKQLAEDVLPKKDVVKFVVPTVTKTRSHGANRMVRETKVKYQGYVFAKLRLTKETYEPIRKMDLCRSWMGTINMKGYKKLPPAPLPLSDEEIESFDLENPLWEVDEQEQAARRGGESSGEGSSSNANTNIIVDTHENDVREMELEESIEKEVQTVYKGLKVEDMIKVTTKNKFHGEDGIVRRLKDEMVLIRFFTYGQTFDEWLDPSDVRKLTDAEILKGLGGPGKPITQQDLDGTNGRDDSRDGNRPQRRSDSRNSVGAFGGGPAASRQRRQDSNERRFRDDDGYDAGKERENWNWYKENEKRGKGGNVYDDGDGLEFRPASESRRSNKRNDFWAEGDADSQWGRKNNNNNNNKRKNNRGEDDWSSFISQGPSESKPKQQQQKDEADDFFASLMTDLSKDDGRGRGGRGRSPSSSQPREIPASDSDDDFFASLMSEIEDEPSSVSSSGVSSNSDDDDDDFFASLEREIRGSESTPKRNKNKVAATTAVSSDDDDFFASLEMELETDLGRESSPTSGSSSSSDDDNNNDHDSEDDFFASLESELDTDLSSSDNEPFAVVADMIENEDPPSASSSSPPKRTPAASKPKTSPSAGGGPEATDLQKRTVVELKGLLKERGLKVSGKKAELIERLTSGV
eukprot:CAMPEP_0172369778 /NCGR_PEP_ID=MMETSP1060-20121228/34452_1 /TAXON_ID=37318 /ORGANISM="Pseudo-nitzschia pungens, Strain cf. cingulata" /LENGTH=728 /DNA_ID=CAMNT_0013094831 /DNA_START=64 /DNA_END=2250 /DNA_ORIENTATION=+